MQSRGSYIILIKLPQDQTIDVGSLGAVHFPRGHYAYVGSAMAGFKPRLERHLKSAKKCHWHIDYLLERAPVAEIVLCEANKRIECTIARSLNSQLDSVSGFGSSDCKCPSHLFFGGNEIQAAIIDTLTHLGMKTELFQGGRADRQ